jgi:hypothetical protein
MNLVEPGVRAGLDGSGLVNVFKADGESCSANWDSACSGKIGQELARCLAEHQKGNHMTTFTRSGIDPATLARHLAKDRKLDATDDSPGEPMPDEWDQLSEQIKPHLMRYSASERAATAQAVKGHYKALRDRGLNHKMASAAVVGMLSADRPVAAMTSSAIPMKTRGQGSGSAQSLSENVNDGPGDLPPELAAMVGPLQGEHRLEVEMAFKSRYAELRKKMDAARARNQAAIHAKDIASRLIGLIGPRPDSTVLDPDLHLTATETAYWNASERLAAEVAKVQAVDPTKPYDRVLAEVKSKHPQLVETIRVSPVQREASDAAFKDRDEATSKIEALMLAEKLTWRQAYDRILAADRSLVERAVAER